MDEDITIIDNQTRVEKIKIFFIKKKKLISSIVIILILILISFFAYQSYQSGNRERLADKYNAAVLEYKTEDKSKVFLSLKEIIQDKDKTYSPLALYFIIDNNIITSKDEVNRLFDIVIEEIKLENEIKNLVIYKKALFNSNLKSENSLLGILKPLINSDSIWKSHALYLMGNYYLSRNEKQKANDFFEKILELKNPNVKILEETKKLLD